MITLNSSKMLQESVNLMLCCNAILFNTTICSFTLQGDRHDKVKRVCNDLLKTARKSLAGISKSRSTAQWWLCPTCPAPPHSRHNCTGTPATSTDTCLSSFPSSSSSSSSSSSQRNNTSSHHPPSSSSSLSPAPLSLPSNRWNWTETIDHDFVTEKISDFERENEQSGYTYTVHNEGLRGVEGGVRSGRVGGLGMSLPPSLCLLENVILPAIGGCCAYVCTDTNRTCAKSQVLLTSVFDAIAFLRDDPIFFQ